jgi:hypothetical protein
MDTSANPILYFTRPPNIPCCLDSISAALFRDATHRQAKKRAGVATRPYCPLPDF